MKFKNIVSLLSVLLALSLVLAACAPGQAPATEEPIVEPQAPEPEASEPAVEPTEEPVSMLDASVRVEILKLMRALQESHGLSVIYITHDLSTVKYFSRRIFVMYAGNLIEKAETRRLLDNPLHPYTLALLAATSDPDARNADTFKEVPPGEPPSLVNPPMGCRFHPRCAHAIAGLCNEKEPPDFEPEPEHFVACWLYE